MDQPSNRLAELKRPSSEFPRQFVLSNMIIDRWEPIEPMFRDLVDRPISSVEALEKWMRDWDELDDVIDEEGTRRHIAMTCATEDEEVEQAFLDFIENIDPKTKPYRFELQKKLIECPYTQDLNQERFALMLRAVRNQIELFREENIPLQTELDKLSQQYQKITGSMTVDFQGKERTMQEMGVFFEKNERPVREDAFRTTGDRRLQDTEKLEDIFDKMLELRQQVAKNAGFDSFREFQHRAYNRFDYLPDDCYLFHKAVETAVTPLSRASLKERQQALNLDSVRPWDVACDRYGRKPLVPFEAPDQLAKGCREIFGKVDPELGDVFQKMIDLGLLDLGSRKGKAPGGYQSTLSEMRLPFIFMNAAGLNRDVVTMLHEGGHAFHSFATRHEPIASYRHAPMEFCEVASMAMEHLGDPYLEVFYSPTNAARSRHDHLESAINLLPWIAIIDAFQHWIYTNPGHSREDRRKAWIGVMERFGPGVDFSGIEQYLDYRWHAQLHIFEVPFYYIEYGIALLGALQVWNNSLEDHRGAVEAYKTALKLGGSRPLPELFETASAKFDFSESTIQPLMDRVQAEMAIQAEQERG